MSPTTRRVLTVTAAAAVALVAAVLIVVHTAPVRSRVLAWSAAQLAARYDLVLTTGDFRYNALTRRVTMRGVRLAAGRHQQRPFFTADLVEVRLPWVVFRGRLVFQHITVDGARVDIHRDQRGESNLPSPPGPRTPRTTPLRLDVRGFDLRSLDFLYTDEARDFSVRAPGVRSDMRFRSIRVFEGVSGPLAIGGGVRVTIGQREYVAEPIAGAMAFDGSTVSLQDLILKSPEASLTLKGRIVRAIDAPEFDLAVEGPIDLARGSAWTPTPIPVSGTANVAGTFTGPLGAFTIDLQVNGVDVGIGLERGVVMAGPVHITPDRVASERFTLQPASGGAVHTRFDVPFAASASASVDAEWDAIDARSAFRLGNLSPWAVGARLKGRMTAVAERPGDPLTVRITNTARAERQAGLVPLDADTTMRIGPRDWSLDQAMVAGAIDVVGKVGGARSERAFLDSELSGIADVVVRQIGTAAGNLETLGITAPALMAQAAGRADAQLTLGGTLRRPEYTGPVRSNDLLLPGLDTMRVAAVVDGSTRRVELREVDVTRGTARAKGEVTFDLERRTMAGSASLAAPDAVDLQGGVPQAWSLAGPIDADVRIHGTFDDPRVSADLRGRELAVQGQPIDRLTARAEVIGTRVELTGIDAHAGDGRLTGRFTYDWNSERYDAIFDGSRLSWQGALGGFGDVTVPFDFHYEGAGTFERPGGNAEVTMLPASGALDRITRGGKASARFAEGTAFVTAHLPGAGTFVTGQAQTTAPYAFDGIAVVNEAALGPLFGLAGISEQAVEGTASLSATAKGRLDALADSSGFVNLQSIDATVEGVSVRLPQPSRLSWRGNTFAVDELLLNVGSTGILRVAGRLSTRGEGDWRGSFSGNLDELTRVARAAGVGIDGQVLGRIDATWQSSGGLVDTIGEARVSGASVELPNGLRAANVALTLTADERNVTLGSLSGTWQDGGISGSASVPRRRLLESIPASDTSVPLGTAQLRVTRLTEAAFAPWLSPEQLRQVDGEISATLDATIASPTAEGITAALTVDSATFTLGGVPATQVRPSRVRFDAGALTIDDVMWQIGGGAVSVTGGVRVGAETELDLTARGTLDLRALSVLLPEAGVDGAGELYVRIGGTADAPAPDGRLELRGAELAWSDPQIVISGLTGPVLFDRTRIRVERLTGSANGGSLLIDGSLNLDGAALAGGSLIAQLQRVALELSDGIQSEADALLRISPSRDGWLIAGDVRVSRSSFSRNISIPALAAGRTRVNGGQRDTFADRVRLDLDVHTVEDMAVDNNYGRIDAGAALRISGTAAEPGLTGRVTLREGGEVYLVGRTFRVVRGAISFLDPTRIEPDLDIELRTVANGEDILLTLSGTLDQLTTNVRSETDATRTSSEIIATLLGTDRGLTGTDAATLLSAELLGATGRALGLDALRLERGFNQLDLRSDPGLLATETDPSTRLTLSKRLSPEVEVTLSQNLTQSGLSAIVSYRPRRNIELRAVTLDNTDRSVGLRHEVTFGGGSPLQQAAAEERREVGEIRITGTPGRSQGDVLASLRLGVGDRFDFQGWQRDVSRLRDWYRAAGRLEARVRASREDLADGRVALVYHLDEGPLTEVRVTGWDLSASERREIEEIWTRAIFDRFLVQVVRERVHGFLVLRDIVGSTVDASVEAPVTGRKVLTIAIAPGTKVTDRRMAFSGNAAFDESRLRDIVHTSGLAGDGWLDRPGLVEALEDAYERSGYLDARVTVGDPRVEERAGVLPVTVDEGRLYRIARVAFEGVAESRLPMAREAVALPLEDPYRADEIETARRALEQRYRALGFNEARIETRSQVTADTGEVALTIAVDEGAQQVLAGVVVEGATRTKEGVITGALDLEVGSPVDLGGWARARKRLYDTNVFREVDIEAEHLTEDAHEASGVEKIRARVRVVEWPAWRVRYGLELSDERLEDGNDGTGERNQSFGITTDVLNQNLFGRAIAGGVAGRYERDRWTARTFFSTPRFFGLPVTSSLFLRVSSEDIPVSDVLSYVSDVRGVTFEQRWRPVLWSELAFSYRFEHNRTYDPNPSPEDPFPLDFSVDVARLNASGLVDRRDDPFNPTQGWFSSVTWSQAARGFGADYKNGRLFVQQYFFRAFGPFVLASRAQVGTQFGEEALLPSERFFAGGATTVRGYAENALGPRDVLDRSRGGNAVIVLNQEARFPIYRWVRGVAFIDAGNAFAERGTMSFGDLELGYGLGLRLDTPFALLRVDVGLPAASDPRLLRRSSGTRLGSGRIYLGVGHIF